MILPSLLATELHPGDATAATWRLTLALLSVARGTEYYTHKPGMAKLAGIRMDNADRLLDPVRLMTDRDGQPLFEHIIYERGRQKREAGQIMVKLRYPALELLRGSPVEIDDEEFARYSIATALTLRLRIGAEHIRAGGKVHHWRLNSDSAVDLLGTPVQRAGAIEVVKDGAAYETVSLSRAWKNAMEPAIRQINDVSRDFRVLASVTRQSEVVGSPWVSVDIAAHRVASSSVETLRTPVRKSIRDLDRKERHRNMIRDNA